MLQCVQKEWEAAAAAAALRKMRIQKKQVKGNKTESR
jgi:hypothetical protein